MKKQLYESPTLDRIEIQTEQGFAASPELLYWYNEGGKGDFSYDVQSDETWG